VYAPGFLVRVEKQNWQQTLEDSSEGRDLRSHAIKANATQDGWFGQFTPISLNVYLTRSCNLTCDYCFSDPANANPNYLMSSTESILNGAYLVAENCNKLGAPMTFVLNGGGEPTLDQRIEALVDDVRAMCTRNDVFISTYLATNGMMSADRALKVSSVFDLIGLSCDGPPEIHDIQRPSRTGEKSSIIVERTAAIFHQNNQAFETRVTLTRESWRKMTAIAAYLTKVVRPQAINVELAYCSPNFSIDEGDIELFVCEYFSAREICQEAGISWHTSAIRPAHHHRQYCHILQNALQVIPGDAGSLCFLDNDQVECMKRGTDIAIYDQGSNKWIFDHTKINDLRKVLLSDQEICNKCFVASHCHRSCPDNCPITYQNKLPDIHCKLNRRLFNESLERSGNELVEYCRQQQVDIAGKGISEC